MRHLRATLAAALTRVLECRRPFTPEELRPVLDAVDRERIHDDFYGWFRHQVFHVPLECGKTVVARRRACRHIGKTRGALLLVHGFSQNRYAWHVPGRSLVNHLAEAGYDVFFVDLRGSRESVKLGARPARGVHEVCISAPPFLSCKRVFTPYPLVCRDRSPAVPTHDQSRRRAQARHATRPQPGRCRLLCDREHPPAVH